MNEFPEYVVMGGWIYEWLDIVMSERNAMMNEYVAGI